MPTDPSALSKDLVSVLAKHGVTNLPAATTASPANVAGGSLAASYIREIITGSQAFDPETLANVGEMLRNVPK